MTGHTDRTRHAPSNADLHMLVWRAGRESMRRWFGCVAAVHDSVAKNAIRVEKPRAVFVVRPDQLWIGPKRRQNLLLNGERTGGARGRRSNHARVGSPIRNPTIVDPLAHKHVVGAIIATSNGTAP